MSAIAGRILDQVCEPMRDISVSLTLSYDSFEPVVNENWHFLPKHFNEQKLEKPFDLTWSASILGLDLAAKVTNYRTRLILVRYLF